MTELKPPRLCWGLCQRRECSVPTRRGWLVLIALFVGLIILFVKTAHPFLAPNDPVTGGALVVEGWAPDYVFREAMEEFKRHPYTKLYVTGGPMEKGAFLSQYKTHAQIGEAVLIQMGFDTNRLQAVPGPSVEKDRTYSAALALRRWLQTNNLVVTNFNLISVGPHARRSRLLFEKALDKGANVGVIAVSPRDYNPTGWYKSSAGVRSVLDEAIAYVYARLFFWPGRN